MIERISSFFLTAALYSITWIKNNILNHPSVDGHLGGFQSLAIQNRVVMDLCTCMCICLKIKRSSPGGLTGSEDLCVLTFDCSCASGWRQGLGGMTQAGLDDLDLSFLPAPRLE